MDMPDFLEGTGIFLMHTGLIETMPESLRGAGIFASSRAFG
jgi:hypothetical protein